MKIDGEGARGKEMRPKWWRRFRIGIAISVSVLIIAQCATYLFGYIDVYKLCGGLIALSLGIPLSYAIAYFKTEVLSEKTRLRINRIAFVGAEACISCLITLFGSAFLIWALGLPAPTNYLGADLTFILLFIVSPTIGAFIGYWIGKRRNYRDFM